MAKWLGIDSDVFYIGGMKILHIGHLTLIYALIGFFYAKIMEFFMGQFNEEEENKKSAIRQTLEVLGMLWFAGVWLFIIDNIAHKIPTPFYLSGYKYNTSSHIDKIRAAGVFIFVFTFFQGPLLNKIRNNFIKVTRNTDLPNL